MSKIYFLSFAVIIPFFTGLMLSAAGQESNSKKENNPDLEVYKKQTLQLVEFIESTFNTLGDPTVTIREKDIIINESYLKFFRDEKVQIEDDLDENRLVVTNKNVQAYLKDITFFFKRVTFDFTVEDISQEMTEKGQTFFKVTLQRNLTGTTIEDSLVNNVQTRYIEINLDTDKKDLKIASIYTTKLSEQGDMANWWYQLPYSWKEFFSTLIIAPDSIDMRRIYFIGDSSIVMEHAADTILPESAYDTLYIDTAPLYLIIRQIWIMETIDISGNQSISTLDPLKKLTRLRSVSIANTGIEDLSPLRNLTRIERFDCSGTPVTSIEPLHYSFGLMELNIENTLIDNIGMVGTFKSMQLFNCSRSKVYDLESLSELKEIKELRCHQTDVDYLAPLQKLSSLSVLDLSSTHITSLEPIRDLVQLSYLNIGNTVIRDLEPLKNLTSLTYLYMDYTPVNQLEPLLHLPYLKRIYCDHSQVTGEMANIFMVNKPGTLVIYETGELTNWWNSLDSTWATIFAGLIELDSVPTTEQLHQITLIRKLVVHDDSLITDLNTLSKLINLDELNISNTPVRSLEPLQKSIQLRSLDISGTQVTSLEQLRNLPSVEWLNLSGTPVTDLEPLRNSIKLSYLNIENTGIESVLPLAELTGLTVIWADQTNLTRSDVALFLDKNPSCKIIFQTALLVKWWDDLSEGWKKLFLSSFDLNDPPDREELHHLMNLEDLVIRDNTEIADLSPLSMMYRMKKITISSSRIRDLWPLKELIRLEKLICRESPVISIAPVKSFASLKYLDISNTQVADHIQLAMLITLEYLNISGTPVKNLKWIANLQNLAELDISNTGINNINELVALENLRTVKCFNTKLSAKKVQKFRYLRPEVEVIHY